MNRFKDTLIKILSLGIGLAIGVVLIAKVCFELSYDSFYKDVDRIYWITENIIFQEGGDPDDFWGTSGGIAPGFKAEVPGVEAATRYSNLLNGNLYDESDNLITGLCIGADTCFFDFFNREFLAGDPMQALQEYNGDIAVSRSFAEKLGGVNEAIGKQMFVVDVLKLAVIAALFGVAIAYFVSDKWLELFAIRISLSSMYFIIGAVVVLLIVTVVVVLSSNRVARMNPVKSLKNN
jgi:ABC-type antimicrobial peptide transport system permease subunit